MLVFYVGTLRGKEEKVVLNEFPGLVDYHAGMLNYSTLQCVLDFQSILGCSKASELMVKA